MCTQPFTKKILNKLTTQGVSNTAVEYRYQDLPCGKCPQCIKARLYAWLFRFEKEAQVSTNPLFVTLTYNADSLPKTDQGKVTLVKKDVQDYLKRLRFHHHKKYKTKLVYMAVGEYGTKRGRPHYHLIIFNLPTITHKKSCYTYNLLFDNWKNGRIDISPIHSQKWSSLVYSLKYIMNPQKSKVVSQDRQREFMLCSKGIGKSYLDKARKFHTQSSDFNYVQNASGQKLALPKYYKEKLYKDELSYLRLEITKKADERAKSKIIAQNEAILKKFPNFTYEEADVYRIKLLQAQQLSKKLLHKNNVL